MDFDFQNRVTSLPPRPYLIWNQTPSSVMTGQRVKLKKYGNIAELRTWIR
jgi:hypothetical protein